MTYSREWAGIKYDLETQLTIYLTISYICFQFYVPALLLVSTLDSGTESVFPFGFDVRAGGRDAAMDFERPSAQLYFKACRMSSGFWLIFLPNFILNREATARKDE